MSISIYIGHTGQCLRLDPGTTTSLEAVKSWIASQTNIQTRSQILLTAQGKQVRTQTLLTESELFVFDSGWLNGKKAASPSKESTESLADDDFHPGPAPDTITNTNDLASWQSLFKVRRSWAAGLLDGCGSRAKQAEQLQDRKAVIERSLGVAVASLQQHIKSAEKQYSGVETWAAEQLQEQQAHADNWEHNLDSLRSIPARPEFTRFVQPMTPVSGSRRHSQQNIATLQGYVDIVTVKQAANAAKASMSALANKLDNMRGALDTAANSSNDLLQAVDQINNHSTLDDSASDPGQLLGEIDLVVKKMATDLEHVQSLPRTPQACAQASKMALLHTRNYLPNLHDYSVEMNELVQKSRRERDGAAEMALEHMRTLSAIESQLAKLYQDIKELDMPEDQQAPFITLSIISRLPSVYGHLLVESVRRREWVAKMKRDSATLQEEVATYQEEEEKRRKKWMRNVDDLVSSDALQSHVLGIELSLQNEGGSWPMVTREELAEYLNTLLDIFGQGPVTDEIDQAIKDLDKLTRKQIKHAKAFKNGSMHEAAFGDTSLFLRGDDSNKALQNANARLEEDLKAQKSRVRKLEDLLHRSSQLSKASTGDIFTPTSDGALSHRVSTPTMPIGTPQQYDDFSRNSSMSKRRPSFAQNQSIEERRLAKRVVDLEADLQAHKEEAVTRKNSDVEVQKQVEEAMTTKKDLMANMDAQQREFAVERRNLERELAEAKEKADEAENEVERLLGSRDGIDEEISRLKEDAAGHAARAATEHDARSNIERKLEQAEAARRHAEEELQKVRQGDEQKREAEADQLQIMATAHAHLAADTEAPSGILGLATALEELARRSAAHAKDLEEAIAFAKSENESLASSNERQKTELAATAQRQAESEEEVRQTREKLSAEEAKTKSLELQLVEEQEQLQSLRNKFAEGETGSEVLRQRVTEEEERVAKLRTELAEAKSLNNSLDVEILRLQKKQKSYHSTAEASAERLHTRADRAKEVSQKLYSQNLRLVRLLERLGLVVTHEGEKMAVERASKMAASTTMVDPSMYMSRQVSTASPPPTRKPSTTENEPADDLRMLHWPDAQSLDDESAQYDAFLQYLSRFDLDVFADAVTKRVKDFEYTAKKYSKEAKESTKRAEAYKERALKLRSEAHAKIAVRDFKEGDLSLFLPTRGGQVKGAWAAFNIGCPHYFLAEKESMRLGSRDFIVARIQKVEQKIVDLSGQRAAAQIAAEDDASDAASSMQVENDNPFDLSDGLTWWMVHATEERGPGAAPTTPGLGKSTVSTANVDAKGSIRIKRSSKSDDASKHLNKSLDSRRSSSASKKNLPATSTGAIAGTSIATPHAETPRQRSESQASSLNNPMLPTQQPRPLPAPAGSGLGITSDPQPHEQIRNLPAINGGRRPSASPSKTRQRSQSPSKSVRSLQKHLESSSTPTKPSPAKKPGWESLWSAEFSVESPSKEKKMLLE